MFPRKGPGSGFLVPLLLSITLFLLPAGSQAKRLGESIPGETVWTNWGMQQHALADDGQSIWIGATGFVLQVDKQTGDIQQYGRTVGLLHRQVLAVAVDPAGNRWFGGDAGLSRLGPDGLWTHYTGKNSPLPVDLVRGIAVGTDGTLWLDHGGAGVSRWDVDGSNHLYASRRSAVLHAYEQVKETANGNDLWAVAGDEVWVGYNVYDGLTWEQKRPPEGSEAPLVVRADSRGNVWVVDGDVFRWNGSDWSRYWFEGTEETVTALGISADDKVWVGWSDIPHPYTDSRSVSLIRLPETPGLVLRDWEGWTALYDASYPITALLPAAEAVWGIGPGWLSRPDLQVIPLEVAPRYERVTNVVMTARDRLFLYSRNTPDEAGGLQVLVDQSTTALGDDSWQLSNMFPSLTAITSLPDGGLWSAGYSTYRDLFSVMDLERYTPDSGWLDYEPSLPAVAIADIFVEDGRHTWFAFDSGVYALDDGGTPEDMEDDLWTTYGLQAGRDPAVAVDALGRLWYGDTSGLYRYDGLLWEPVNLNYHACDLAPAADGTLFVELARYHCRDPLDPALKKILIVRPDGTQERKTINTLVDEEFDRVTTASRRNQLWTVAPDGAVWYLNHDWPLQIERHDGESTATYPLPVTSGLRGGTLEIGDDNSLWLAGNGQLWRLAPLADFRLDEKVGLVTPGSSRQWPLGVRAIGDYSGSISLDLSGLPEGVTATFAPNPLPAGEVAQLTLTADQGFELGTYDAVLAGTDGAVIHTAPFTLKVVPTIYDAYAPLVAGNR